MSTFPGGVWPVMLTPFTEPTKEAPQGAVDYDALAELVQWYKENGVSGLFAVCQSSEMFYLSLEERVEIARFVKEQAGNIPVIASGHISDRLEDQAEELNRMAETGVDAVILITNRLAKQEEPDEVWFRNLEWLLRQLPEDLKLGFYECPYPYKRLLTPEMIRYAAESGRFYFIKDTSCEIENMRQKLDVMNEVQQNGESRLKLYNANGATLHETLKMGAAGYSGVMANMQCRLLARLCRDYAKEDLTELADYLSVSSTIERQIYPVNAKYYLQREGLHLSTFCRTRDRVEFTNSCRLEMDAFRAVTKRAEERWL